MYPNTFRLLFIEHDQRNADVVKGCKAAQRPIDLVYTFCLLQLYVRCKYNSIMTLSRFVVFALAPPPRTKLPNVAIIAIANGQRLPRVGWSAH